MEYAEEGLLFDRIEKYGPVSLEEAAFYMIELICALEHLHGIGIVHRDIKRK